jgi:hypothetical protein
MSTLKVYPNPWIARDRNGLPCGVCPRDPESDGGGPGQFVGARVDRKRTEILQKLGKGDDMRSPMQRTVYEFMGIPSDDPELEAKLFACEPIALPRSKYYRDQIRQRALIAADAETAKAAKLKFVPRKAKADVKAPVALDSGPSAGGEFELNQPLALAAADAPKKSRGGKSKAETDEV